MVLLCTDEVASCAVETKTGAPPAINAVSNKAIAEKTEQNIVNY
jgi:hypothetical protein